MARISTKKNLVKDVNYLNKDFSDFRDNLIEFAKIYFPNTYNDFNEASPGMMFIEMASYVGDVLSYYINSQFRESLLAYAEEKRNVYSIAQSFGYKPIVTSPATVKLDVFQTVPALDNKPDLRYALNVKAGAIIKSKSTGTTFRTLEDANFNVDTISSPRVLSIFETDSGNPTKFLLKKSVTAQSGEITTEYFTFGAAEKYSEVQLANSDVIEIISCTDTDGNNWYEVDSLARDTIFEDVENNSVNDPTSVLNRDVSPYILKLKKVSKRFTTFINENDQTLIRFGAGISSNADEEIIPNPDSVGSNLPGSPTYLTKAFDPSNFLNTKTFGQAPSNTTLSIKYSFGGGVDDNASANDVNEINSITFEIQDSLLVSTIVQESKDSVGFTNPNPATGGGGGQTIREVRDSALAYYQAQQRAVTKDDYIVRAYSLPAKYGNIAKVHLVQDDQLNKSYDFSSLDEKITDEDVGKTLRQVQVTRPNPLAMDMYTLGYASDGSLTKLTDVVKENLKTYLSQYRLFTDAINIKDAYIIHLGVDFSILTKAGFNKNDVLLRCVSEVQDFFDVNTFQIGQPIVLSDLVYRISLVDGVSSVVRPNDSKEMIQLTNKFKPSEGYSGNVFDLESATINGVVYTALDPSIFEIKFPNSDIKGSVVGDNTGLGA